MESSNSAKSKIKIFFTYDFSESNNSGVLIFYVQIKTYNNDKVS